MTKITKTLNDVLANHNIQLAIDFLKTKKNACGDDGIWLHDLDSYWNLNKQAISAQIFNKTYKPQIVHEKIIVMANGKHRKIALMSSLDRMLLRAVLQILKEPMDSHFSEYSFAYRENRNIEDAVSCAAAYIENGKEYVVEIDLKDFFDNIQHKILLQSLQKILTDINLYNFIEQYISCQIEFDFRIQQKICGLLQGSPLSPLLSNLYLTELDNWMEEQGYCFTRYADNLNIYVENLQTGYETLEQVEEKIQSYGLEINQEKKGIYTACSRRYLGYVFEKVGKNILIKKQTSGKQMVFSKWHKSAIEKVENQYYLINDGVLSKKDFNILFENSEKKAIIPVGVTDSINIYSNLAFNSNLFEILHKHNLNLNIYDRYANYLGSFYSNRQRNRMKCLIKQVIIYQNLKERLVYAKQMENASLHNLRCNLQYYHKNYPSNELQHTINFFYMNIKKIKRANSIDELMLLEAQSRLRYYSSFNQMIQEKSFQFTQRTKRPPKDPINAMISFGNTYLYQKISQIISKTSLDIRISFVHSAMKRYENLNLDLADIFKPIIVDRVIFTLINKKMISEKKHFQKVEGGGVYLNQDGKKIILLALEQKMGQAITLGTHIYTYEQLLYREVRNLERSLLQEGASYKAFKYRM